MVKKELIRETAKRSNYAIHVCDEIIREMWEVIAAQLEGHDSVHITNIGTFDVYKRKPRTIAMPRGQEAVCIDDSYYPRFKPAASLKEKVK